MATRSQTRRPLISLSRTATVSSMVIAQLEVATPPGFRLETLLLLSGIGNLLAGRMDSFLYILDDIHRGGVNLLGLTLDLMAHIAGEFPISRFKLAFGVFGCSFAFIRHDSRGMGWKVESVARKIVA